MTPVVSQLSPRVSRRRTRSSPVGVPAPRPSIAGKYLAVGKEPFYVRGVSYGAFRPDEDKREYTRFDVIARDFALMAEAGINTVRIPHTMPPPELLDIAGEHGLRVMVGLSAEQYVGYLADRHKAPDVEAIVRRRVRSVAGHPALLCYGLGNEISAPLARWIGPKTIQRYLHRLYQVVKAEDPEGLVTYVNYPTTEYLDLPFLDFVSFNIYLETPKQFEAYVGRLQNLAGNRPLLLSEIGLDSLRNGLYQQADVLGWQLRSGFVEGCCGTVIFSWTDEWYRAGEDVDDWKFGLTDERRLPKPALIAVREVYAQVPFADQDWPSISVVVCSYNGSRTIRGCLEGLSRLDYPNYEVIVVDDGSTDSTADVVAEFPGIRLIRTDNRGLSAARNTGAAAAQGQIVAYLDDDAFPDRHWLHFLASAFLRHDYAAVGGPNVAPSGDGLIAACVTASPGGPAHVLIDDRTAEHIPGCNMAFRRDRLLEVGGFDPTFRVAGDDVDICWKIADRGWTIGFSAGALVWHRRRNSVGAFWKQQKGYGHAESLLEAKWPQKYNSAGHPTWVGRVYTGGGPLRLFTGTRIYHGTWGTAPFQLRQPSTRGWLSAIPLMPEWYLILAALAALSLLGLLWPPLLLGFPLFAGALAATVIDAFFSARAARHEIRRLKPGSGVEALALTAALHLLQPLARLAGRLQHGLTPWRRRAVSPGGHVGRLWPHSSALLLQGTWQPLEEKLRTMESLLHGAGAVVRRGGAYDRWDFHVYGGLLGGARALVAMEDHGPTTQLIRLRAWPSVSWIGLGCAGVLATLAQLAARDGALSVAGLLGGAALFVVARTLMEAMRAAGSLQAAASGALPGARH